MSYQVLTIADVASGLLMYIAQAFLLAASIFGLDYYVTLIARKLKTPQNDKETTATRNQEQ